MKKRVDQGELFTSAVARAPAPAAGFTPVPAPRLWSPSGELLLPERVRLISLWQPYCGLVAAGVKLFETRERKWPHEPSWLAIYATKNANKAAFRRLGAVAAAHHGPCGVVLALVWIGGSRPMRPEDATAACYPFELQRFVWIVGAAHRLQRPIPLERGPQNIASISRDALAAALDRAA